MKEVHSFGYDGLKFRFFVDDRFTLVWVYHPTQNKNAFGQAFCSQKDEFDTKIGMWVALHRLFDNLKLSRSIRLQLAKALALSLEPNTDG